MPRRLSSTPLSQRTLARAKRHSGLIPAAPPPAGNTRALRTGAQSDGRNLPTFAATLAIVHEVIAEGAPWILATDRFAVENFAATLTTFRHAEAAFGAMSQTALMKKHKAQRVNVQRLRALNEMARDLGLTPAGRIKLGLQVAKTAAIVVSPVRTESRAMEVAQILADARVLPPTEAEVEPEADAVTVEAEGEVVPPLRAIEGDAA
jgi:hypothetical protein